MELVKKFNENPNQDLVLRSSNWLPAKEHVMMGIDEAGRGPVLGPMVYAAAFYPLKLAESMKEKNFADSKTLSEVQREQIFESIESDGNIAWVARIISPNTISTAFYRREKYNLNELSHDAATQLAREVISSQVFVDKLYVDTVGKPEKYSAKLRSRLPSVKEIKVESKADSSFAVVSAASIVAKVLRDACLKNWKFPEGVDLLSVRGVPFGCGYPNDSITTSFLRKCFNPVFGFPTFIRFNWSTASNILDSKGYSVKFDESSHLPTQCNSKSPGSSVNSNEPGSKRKVATITNYFAPVAKKIKVDSTLGGKGSDSGEAILQKKFHLNRVCTFDQLFTN